MQDRVDIRERKEQTLKEITQTLIKGKRLLIYLLRDESHFLVSVYSLWREQLMGSSVNGVSSTLILSWYFISKWWGIAGKDHGMTRPVHYIIPFINTTKTIHVIMSYGLFGIFTIQLLWNKTAWPLRFYV